MNNNKRERCINWEIGEKVHNHGYDSYPNKLITCQIRCYFYTWVHIPCFPFQQLLSSIIRPYLPIIKNKNLSTNSNKEKLKAWREITEK